MTFAPRAAGDLKHVIKHARSRKNAYWNAPEKDEWHAAAPSVVSIMEMKLSTIGYQNCIRSRSAQRVSSSVEISENTRASLRKT